MAIKLAPIGNFTQYFDNDGKPLASGKLFTYAAGSFSSLATTYTSSSGSVANSNPIQLDAAGRTGTAIWIESTASYNFVLTKSDGTTVLMNTDNVTG